MPSLQQILAAHSCVLLIDSASTVIQVGLLRRGSPPQWETSREESGSGVFACTQALLSRAELALDRVDAFVFCEGPGSILGIRTTAVALRTWSMLRPRPVFAYRSLDLVATYQLHHGQPGPFSVIADARRESWHVVTASEDGRVGPLQRVKAESFSGSLFMPENFRAWAPLPENVRLVPYSIASMIEAMPDAPLFREAQEPDAFLHEEPTYQTWTPQIHRAPL